MEFIDFHSNFVYDILFVHVKKSLNNWYYTSIYIYKYITIFILNI